MEVVVKNPEEARSRGCVLEHGSVKPLDPRGKALEEEPKSSGSRENAREMDARVSENTDGTEFLSGGVENRNESDSEMNGVSSLLKMKRQFGEKEHANSYYVVDSGEDKSVQQDKESDEEEEEEEEHGFQVGDFVWGKIKSHPWWPGQIYDSSDASNLALRVKQKGRLLVAYFGDGTFAWCRPSQLKPFEENFKEFSSVSSSRNFVNAVEEAVEEMGRHVESLITEQWVGRPMAVNAGVNEGVLVPNVRREIVMSLSFEPKEILGDVQTLGKTLTFTDLLELEVLKRKLSAFYQSKRGYSLTEYHDAQPIPGLEDKDLVRVVKLRGPKVYSDEDGLRLHHRRKHKSIAEILETDRAGAEATSAGRKKRKRSDDVKDIEKAGDENSKEKTLSRKRKKRDVDGGDNASDKKEMIHEEESEKKKALDSEEDGDSTLLASLRKKVKVNVSKVTLDNGNDEVKLQTSNDSLSRGRKKRESETEAESLKFSSEIRIGEQTKSTNGDVEEVNEGRSSETPNEPSDLDSFHQELPCELKKAIDFLRMGAPADEVKDQIRATALSPQYPKGDSFDHLMREFVSIYRSFVYHDGVNNKMQWDQTSDKEIDQNRKEQNETSRRYMKKAKVKHQMEKQDSCAELFVMFGPGSNLPKKEDLINIYGKFGPLDEERTYMFYNNFCARVVFKNMSDAEAALEWSKEQCPFTPSSSISFKLKFPSDGYGKSKEKTTEKTRENSRIEVEFVKKKLEEMRSMLDEADGEMTEELKVKLEEDMRKLMEKVSKMIVRST